MFEDVDIKPFSLNSLAIFLEGPSKSLKSSVEISKSRLERKKIQAGVLVLREIRPEYAVPVGVWQIREGIREAMKQKPILTDTLDSAVSLSTKRMSISKSEWFAHGKMLKLLHQKSIDDFF